MVLILIDAQHPTDNAGYQSTGRATHDPVLASRGDGALGAISRLKGDFAHHPFRTPVEAHLAL